MHDDKYSLIGMSNEDMREQDTKRRPTMAMSKVDTMLQWLDRRGCHPSIYHRGELWRAHINKAGNWWAEGETREKALSEAIRLWYEAGRPMDGEADNG